MKTTLFLTAALAAGLSFNAFADEGIKHSTASSHGPIGVMGEHLHKKGEVMLSYRYMRMDMSGNRSGSRRVSAREIVGTMMNPGQFMVAPTSMPMDMHMLGAMFGLNDSVTLMGMTSYVSNSMDHLVRNGRTFTTESSGVGDTNVSALIRMFDTGRHKAHWNLGVSLPTGSIDERDDTPAMANAFLPYPMQLGSGTYDLLPGVTYNGSIDSISWGAQASAVIRTGDNDEGYTLGDEFFLTSWFAKELSGSLSLSLRLNYQDKDSIDGRNPALNPRMVQTANIDLHAGKRLDLSVGLNYLFKSGHRLAVEYAEPVKQDLVGPQLEIDSVLTVGWQKAF